MSWINKPTNINANMSQTTGIPMWVFTLVLTIITIIFVTKTLRKPKPKFAVPKLKQKYSGLRYYLFENDTIHL